MSDGFDCPHCGAPVAASARFCRECGADEETWSDHDDWSVADDDTFDYDDYLRREFPDQAPAGPSRWLLVAVIAAVLLGLLLTTV